MTVRAQECEGAQLRLVAGSQFGNRHGVMALDKAVAQRSIRCLKIEPACLTRELAMLSDCPLFSFLDEGPIPFTQFVSPEQYAALRGAFIGIVNFLLSLRLPVVSPYGFDQLSKAR
jgi:hypothetical protein